VPHMVTLPISTWTTMVNQKDIGAANYGFESAEAMNQATESSNAKQGRNGNEIPKQGGQERSSPLYVERQVPQEGRLASAPGQMGGRTSSSRGIPAIGSERRLDGNQGERTGSQGDSSLSADSQRTAEGPRLRDSNFGDRQQSRTASEGRPSDAVSSGSERSSGRVELGIPVDNRWSGVRDRLDLRPRHLMDQTSEGSGVGSSGDAEVERVHLDTDDKRFDSPTDQQSVSAEFHVTGDDRQADRLDGQDGEDESDDVGDGGRSDDGDVPDDSEGNASSAEGIDGQIIGPDEDDDQDRFFYEPVLSPVGRFTIIADYSKLARILQDGKAADGPAKPYHLRY
jgi:hypothetical protein